MPETSNQGLVPSQRSSSQPTIRPEATAAKSERAAAYARPVLRFVSSSLGPAIAIRQNELCHARRADVRLVNRGFGSRKILQSDHNAQWTLKGPRQEPLGSAKCRDAHPQTLVHRKRLQHPDKCTIL